MLPYLLVLLSVVFWIYLEKTAVNRRSFWIPLLALTFFAAMRSNRVGTDSWKYTFNYTSETPVDNIEFNPLVEPGYQIIDHLTLNFTHNYFWIFLITSLIVVFFNLRVLRAYSSNYALSVWFFITLGSYAFIFNGIRQGLAMAVSVLAIPYLLQKKLLPYLILIAIAFLFHRSALIMIPIYVVVHLNIKDFYKVLLSFLASLFGSQLVISYLAENNPRYEVYTEEVGNAGGYMTLGFYTSIAILLYIIKYIKNINNSYFNLLLIFYTVGTVSIIPVALLGSDPSGPQRVIYYFTWALALLLPYALNKLNHLLFYFAAIIFSISFFILTTSRFGNLVPYIINPLFKIF